MLYDFQTLCHAINLVHHVSVTLTSINVCMQTQIPFAIFVSVYLYLSLLVFVQLSSNYTSLQTELFLSVYFYLSLHASVQLSSMYVN